MPQPTIPAGVKMEQYCPFCQRLEMPIALPCSKVNSRATVRGRESVMAYPLHRQIRNQAFVLPDEGGPNKRLPGGWVSVRRRCPLASRRDFVAPARSDTTGSTASEPPRRFRQGG